MSKSKAAGTRFETAVVDFTNAQGFKVYRKALSGKFDTGDIGGLENWVLELKAERAIELANAMNEAKREARTAGVSFYAALIKRKQHSIGESYLVMNYDQFLELLKISGTH